MNLTGAYITGGIAFFSFVGAKMMKKKELSTPKYILANTSPDDGYKLLTDYLQYRRPITYKLEWLRESINMGKKLEGNGHYVIESIERDLPYYCEDRREFELVDRSLVKNNEIDSLSSLAIHYAPFMETRHESKNKLWKELIRNLAQGGDYVAQAYLCSKGAGCLYSETEQRQFEKLFLDRIISAAKTDMDENALIAYGLYLTEYGSKEQLSTMELAVEASTDSDAWYYLGRTWRAIYFDESTSDSERDVAASRESACILKAAEIGTGKCAGESQRLVAWWYEEGEKNCGCPFEVNYQKALYWYQKAQESGENVKTNIERLSELLGEYNG
ncbi:MAG: sel1 repeat family protein [Lachnospiraceae bacterium]|nr:sel1 repeat family protein [Lachnospiraceae bacterium]